MHKWEVEQKKRNKYDISGKYGIGITLKGEKFIFDLEDFPLISQFLWYRMPDGYFTAHILKYNYLYIPMNLKKVSSTIGIHRLILASNSKEIIEPRFEVDHINGLRWDNRKENLRLVTREQNGSNSKIQKNNSSGHTGVSFHKKENKWEAFININHKKTYLGLYDNYEDAVKVREKAEKKYYGDFRRASEFLNNGKESKMGGD